MAPSARPIPLLICALSVVLASGCTVPSADPSPDSAQPHVEKLRADIVRTHSFDPALFTQGLEVEPEGTLLVSTGMWGESGIFRRTIEGYTLDSEALPNTVFGEGATRFEDTIWQITWKSGTAIKRDAHTLQEQSRTTYEGEGWGLCSFDDQLVMSNGTAQLRLLDPHTFAERSRLTVTLNGEPVTQLNELECVDDSVYANVFQSTDIMRIDALSGQVTGVIDASSVPNSGPAGDPNAVLNGIAHVPGSDTFCLTGKRWSEMSEVRFRPSE
ncbi:glutaminyl-peptide cyclotransferase [Corynebacterium tapiri]|uniref:Glutaminyl-peptide cyclotransferase n=2 Tax=Corynebacterium tapiri TaxID=1448266 RepID=A0A5C4U889_9CORY|nr:glutaminyl-peptide cyclotransferase [Corynebacterium tapiri]TNM00387.1 glutaminyl-peptide cyclotransferase [Corynebacterium tapiri]